MNLAHSRILIAPLLLLTATNCRDGSTASTPDLSVANDDLAVGTDDMSATARDMSAAVDSAGTRDLVTSSPDLPPLVVPTEFVVVRVGDGAAALSAAAAAVFLERRKISDGSIVGTPLALPTAVAAANKRLTISGSSQSEGALSLSVDRKYLLITGYDADVGTASVATTASATTNRVIGVIDGASAINTSTAADFFTAGSARGAMSTDGKDLWAAGSKGIVYTTLGSTAAPTALNTANMRWLNIFNGQLYVTSASGATQGVNTVGNGTPKATATPTLLSGFETQTATSHYGFIGFDRDATPGIDVIYVADDSTAAGSSPGVQRWSLAANKWKLDGTMAKGLTTGAGARGLTAFLSGNNVVVLATTNETPARVVSFVDDGATALNNIDSKELVKAATNTAYRGISYPPQ